MLNCIEHGGCPAAMTGLGPAHRAQVCAAVLGQSGRPLLALCSDDGEAARMAADLEHLTGIVPVLLAGREFHFRAAAVASHEWEQRRLEALYRMIQGDAQVVVATPEALLQYTLPPELLRRHVITLEADGSADLQSLSGQLTAMGYSRCEQVEGVGQFALRGGILDVFGPGMEAPAAH